MLREKDRDDKSMAPKRIGLYLRVSTLEQATDWFGLDMQERQCLAQIVANENKGWSVENTTIYRDEGHSGVSEWYERPGLSQLRADAIAGKIDVLLVWRIDRLFRKVDYLLSFIQEMESIGVNFASKDESIDIASPTWKLVLTILGAIAEMEREVLLERTREWRISKAKSGYFVFGNKLPYGYMKEHDGRGNKLIVNPDEAEVVREIFELFVKEGKGTSEIASILTARGIWTNREGEGHKEKIHTGLFRQTAIVRILRQTAYIGEYRCFQHKHVKKRDPDGKKRVHKYERPESEWIIMACEPLVEADVFHKAQELLDGSKTIRRNRGENHIFTGLVKCGECGKAFNYYLSHKKTGNYRCWGKKKDKVTHVCTNKDISETKLMEIVWPKIELVIRSETEFLKAYESSLRQEKGEGWESSTKREYAQIEAEIAKKLKAYKDALRRAIEDEANAEVYRSIAQDIALELAGAEKRKSELKKLLEDYEVNRTRMNAVSSKMEELRGKVEQFWMEDKAFFIRELTDFVLIGKEKVMVGYRFEV